MTPMQEKLLEGAVNNTATIGYEIELLKETLQNVLNNQASIIDNQRIILEELRQVGKR